MQVTAIGLALRAALLGTLVLALPQTSATPALGQQVTPPAASERAATLDALFAALQSAGGDDEAAALVPEIWRTWTKSGRAEVDLLMSRAGSSMAASDFGIASLLLDEVVAMAPDFAEGWNRRATLRFMMDDHAGSLADIDRVLALEPRHFGALAGRAMIHAAAERWSEALDAYRAALAVNPFLVDRHDMLPALRRKAEGQRL